ncbi:signal peptidase II [Sedimentitalea todarodis]|uniref:Lipoprotein signal peptidase n=1 Tax=Sedimentitalea todarodis TaxID=1631240 RepID=A0ABU3VA41_9RHOB|nr:signal peptidase II [Sedimentitalea todarodis]MDU9003036.1 signal peptidase II [Sedimentitalea todarodis]
MTQRLLIGAALLAFAADQISKYAVVHAMELSRRLAIDVLPPLLNFRYGENTGINFGLFEGESDLVRWGLIVFSVAVVAAVLLWVRRTHPGSRIMQLCAGLLIGGALGNVFDRLAYGYVLDFLNMSCCGITNPFVFNLADVFIFVGAVGLVLFEGKSGDKTSRDPEG